MDQFVQTNDLQKAIDDVANGGSASGDNGVSQFGVPPMPPMPENSNELPKVEPLVPAEETAPSAEQILSQSITSSDMPPAVEPAQNTEAAPTEAAPAVEAAPATEETPAAEGMETPVEAAPAGDLSDVKQNIIKDLLPLLDKTDKSPEEKFDIYKQALSTMHDVKTVEGAYKTATQIGDEARRADALFEVMRVIDTQ